MRDPLDVNNQSLVEHLTELRDRLIKSAWAIAFTTAVCFVFSERIFDIVRHPIVEHIPSGGLVFTNPMDKFVAHMKLSVVSGVILACPAWIYQIWRFIAPGLHNHEKKYSLAFVGSGVVLFLTGVSFAYFLVLPMAFEFLFNFGGSVDKPLITISEYMSFFATMVLVFGVSFELPLILVALGVLGLISSQGLREKRRYAIVGLATVAAVITPPDVLSMMMLVVPLSALYEISIIIVRLVERKRTTSLQASDTSA
ncbi:MAG: twin-arginine translocase subunit TatC [Bdellovibrionales bacterium]|jgi:sec-independent protein translocase protein TatC|nr:twin-arginine translocase subunit TatC [Bdellovibrionales bacterium]